MLITGMVCAQTKKVAVLDPICRDGSVNNTFKLIVRGQMENVVTSIKEYQAYDRAAFDKIMEEQNFQHSGAVNDSDIKQLGVMAGVDYIVVPEVSAYEGYLTILAKILDVETGRYNKSENEVMKMEPLTVKEVCSNMANKLFSIEGMKSDQGQELQLDYGRYVGQVLNGKPHGKGIVYFNSDDKLTRVSYEGDWVDGKWTGKGIMKWKDGYKYDGEWKNFRFDGQGTYYWVNGNKYVGNYENGKRQGQGTYYYANGNKYVGNFENDKRQGQGTFYGAKGDKFVGNWKDDEKDGEGIEYFANGDRFEGYYENGIINGSGKYYWKNGNRYEGIWKDGHRNGSGTFYYTNGDKDMGTYINDKREGKWVRIKADGKKQKAKYDKGEIVKDWH